MTVNLIELFYIPLYIAIVTLVMVGVGFVMARTEAGNTTANSPQTDALVERTLRKAS